MTRVAYLVAGAGGMYCGTCLRDNRLAATLVEQGRDVILMPLYTPIRTDEKSVSSSRVFYGGINVDLEQNTGLLRKLPGFIHRLLDSNAVLGLAARLAASTDAQKLGALTVSILQGPAGRQRQALDKLLAALHKIEPQVVHLPNLMFVGVAQAIRESLDARVTCSLAGEDIFLDSLPPPFHDDAIELIHQGARAVDAFLSPSRYYSEFCATHYRLDESKIHEVPMGIRVRDIPPPRPSENKRGNTIGYLARICPEKGVGKLVDAFARLHAEEPTYRLRIAGYLGRADHKYWKTVQATIEARGISHAVDFCGEVTREQKWAFLSSLDVLSVPTIYHESKGLYLLESMACGTPVVQPDHGSFTELIHDTGGGILYDPHEAGSLTAALQSLLSDNDRRNELAKIGRRAVQERYNDDEMARRTWNVYEQLTSNLPNRSRS